MIAAGISTYALGWNFDPSLGDPMSPGALLDLCGRLGYRRLQVADNLPLHLMPGAERREFIGCAGARGIALEAGARGLTADHLATCLGIARECGSPFLRMVIDAPGYEPSVREISGLLRETLPILEKTQVILAIENHDRLSVSELRKIMGHLDSPWVGICLDTANSLGAGEGIREVVHALGPYAVNVHLKDIRIRRLPSMQGFTVEGTPLGAGQIPLEWVLSKLERCQSATLEHWMPPLPDPAATRARELDWCAQSTLAMRRLFPHDFKL